MLRDMLGLAGYDVVEAVDGVEALEEVKQKRPDVIILDIMMPRMDGLAFCTSVRSEPATADLPIIVLSGKSNLGAVRKGLSAGANKYMSKPVSMNELFANIQDVLHGGLTPTAA